MLSAPEKKVAIRNVKFVLLRYILLNIENVEKLLV